MDARDGTGLRSGGPTVSRPSLPVAACSQQWEGWSEGSVREAFAPSLEFLEETLPSSA